MNLLGAKLYDPAGAVSKVTTSLLAMTALDTTNLRISFTVPAHGNVLVKLSTVHHGSTTTAQVLLGVLEGATVRGRLAVSENLLGTAIATTRQKMEASYVVSGLTPGAVTWDAAYGVEIVSSAGGALKYGGPNNTTTDDAFGAFGFEVWDPQPIPTVAPGAAGGLQIAGSNAATTYSTLTVTGATTLTGNVALADGLTIAAPSTSNRAGLDITGNGTGAALKLAAGATGKGIAITTTAGDGISILPTAGSAIVATGNGSSKHGAIFTGGTAGTSDGVSMVAGTGGVDLRANQTGTVTTVTTVTNQLTAAAIATGVWQDTTAGDFTTALSIGKTIVNGVTLGTGLTINAYTGNTVQTGDSFARIGVAGVSLTAVALADVTSDAVIADAVWNAATASYGTAGSYGLLIETDLDATVSSRLATAGYTAPTNLTAAQIATGVWTDATAGDFTAALSVGKSVMNGVTLGTGLTVASVTGAVGSVTGNVGGSVASVTAGVTLAAAAVQAIWDALTSALTTANSIGKKLADWTIGTAQTGDSFVRLGAPSGASVSADIAAVKSDSAAVKAKTDNLPSDPADASDVAGLISALTTHGDSAWATATGFSTLNAAGVRSAVGLGSANLDTQLSAIAGYIDSEIGTLVSGVSNIQSRLPAALVGGRMDASAGAMSVAALAALFTTDSGATFSSAVAGSVVKEIADNAGGGDVTIADGSITNAKFADDALSDRNLDPDFYSRLTQTIRHI